MAWDAQAYDWLMRAGMGTLGQRMGIEIVSAEPKRVVATMPVAGNTQPFGLLHGGASAVLAETLGSIAAGLHGGPQRRAMGIELSCSHHRAATDGTVTGVATAIHLGRTLATYEITITDDRQRLICTARLTCLIIDAPAEDQAPPDEPARPEEAATENSATQS